MSWTLQAQKEEASPAVLFLIGVLFLSIFSFCFNPCLHSPSLLLINVAHAQEQEPVTGELLVFAAASLTEPFTEIGNRLELSHPGLKVMYNFAGSSGLRTQLEQGAHADVFASADAVQMEQAKKSGVVQDESSIFVRNKLIVIIPKANSGNVTEFRDLAKPGLKLDLANANVPVGNYSRQAIGKAGADYGADFEKQTLANIVSEEGNVKQVVTKVQLGEADAGIVYVSDVTPQVGKDVQTIPIPDAYNQIAVYPIALTKDVKNLAAAKAFISFALSAEGQAILKAHNFTPISAR
ncbi:MAG: molybdate ABC transporter substrate-binding protein [Candidatus Binatia bacterium]